jgi:hypothetical protein
MLPGTPTRQRVFDVDQSDSWLRSRQQKKRVALPPPADQDDFARVCRGARCSPIGDMR